MESLCNRYKEYFKIGASVNTETAITDQKILLQHFNSITFENEIKFVNIQPNQNEFDFSNSDKLVEFALANKLQVRGHTLIWHAQLPDWVNKDRLPTRTELLKVMENHICTIVDRYKDSIFIWDVVNEILADDGSLKNTIWREIIGDDYIERAFWFAHDANPKAKLFYNEYNCEITGKRESVVEFYNKAKKQNIPLDGIGLQGHFGIYYPTADMFRDVFKTYAKTDMRLEITEMDMSMFRYEDHRTDLKQPTKEMIETQAKSYGEFFALFREYKDLIDGVTFWGVSDRYTWLDDFPVTRKNWPLIFDEFNHPKKAYDAIMNW